MMLLGLLSFISLSWAGDCNSSQVLCEVSWKPNAKLEMIKLEKGCEFPEGEKRDCVVFQVCQNNEKVDSGANVFFETTDFNVYCQALSPIDLLESKIKNGPSAFIQCDQKSKQALGIVLFAPGKKSQITCALPKNRGSR